MSTSIAQALKDTALIVTLTHRQLGKSRTDKEASKEASRDHKAHGDAAKVVVNRLAGADTRHNNIVGIQAEMSDWLDQNTMIWGKRRLMPNINFVAWLNGHTIKHRLMQAEKQMLEAEADVIIAKIKVNLGDFNVEPPTKDEMVNAYVTEYYPEPIPDINNFGSIDSQIDIYLKEKFEYDVAKAFQDAQMDALERLRKPLANLADRFKAYDERENKKATGETVDKNGTFRDSLTTNLTEIAQALGSFNLMGDPAIAKLVDDLQPLIGLDAKAMRKDAPGRKHAAATAENILSVVDGWLGTRVV